MPTTILMLALLAAAEGGGAAPLLEKGEKLFKQGDVAGAIAAFDEAGKVDPKDARPHYLKGVALEKKGDASGATTAYKAAIARKADFAEAHNNLGALMLAKNDLPGAAGEFEAAVKAKPAYAEAQYNLGRLNKSREVFREALALLGAPMPATTPGMVFATIREMALQTLHRYFPSRFVGSAGATRERALEAARVTLDDDRIVDVLVRRLGQHVEPHLVIPAPLALHRHEIHRGLEEFRDLARAHEEGGVLAKEPRPVLGVLLARRLVGDERVRARLARVAQKLVDELLARNELAAEAAAHVAEELVERSETLRLVHDVDGDREVRARREQQPFPIAVVRSQEDDRLAAVDRAANEIRIGELDARLELLGARTEAPERLDDRVGEVAIALAQQRCTPLGRFLGKRVRDVALGAVPPPSHDMKRNEVGDVPDRIEDRQRDVRERLQEKPHELARSGSDCRTKYKGPEFDYRRATAGPAITVL